MLKTMIVALLLMFAVEACAELRAGDWARYGFVIAKQDAKPSVREITITIGKNEAGMVWWEMAVEMAYDMGARYIWFWTSDHGHHMPYKEQLDLTRTLRAHEKAHPRRPISELLTKPKVAVAVPEGYIGWSEFWPNGIWNNERFGMDRLNEEAVTYRAVVSAAFKQGILLARKGAQFDFVVDGEAARKAGYDRIISIHADGTVQNGVSPL